MIPKANQRVHPIMALKFFNLFLHVYEFCTENAKSLVGSPISGRFYSFNRYPGRPFAHSCCSALTLSTAPWAFTKMLALVLALLHSQKIRFVEYLDNLFFKGHVLPVNPTSSRQALQSFGWVLNLQKSLLDTLHRLKYLGLMLYTTTGETSVHSSFYQSPFGPRGNPSHT